MTSVNTQTTSSAIVTFIQVVNRCPVTELDPAIESHNNVTWPGSTDIPRVSPSQGWANIDQGLAGSWSRLICWPQTVARFALHKASAPSDLTASLTASVCTERRRWL